MGMCSTQLYDQGRKKGEREEHERVLKGKEIARESRIARFTAMYYPHTLSSSEYSSDFSASSDEIS